MPLALLDHSSLLEPRIVSFCISFNAESERLSKSCSVPPYIASTVSSLSQSKENAESVSRTFCQKSCHILIQVAALSDNIDLSDPIETKNTLVNSGTKNSAILSGLTVVGLEKIQASKYSKTFSVHKTNKFNLSVLFLLGT